jgi:hypothetical protein
VLEWVYGSIISTADKSRDCANGCLGMSPPTTQHAYDYLVACLESQAKWEACAKEVRCQFCLCVYVHPSAAVCCLEQCVQPFVVEMLASGGALAVCAAHVY